MNRQNISSGAHWESIVGYSRVVRMGPFVYVAGTTAVDESGQVIGIADPHQQTVAIFKKIDKVLQEAGASLKDVVRTRMFVTNVSDWEEIGRAHEEFFRETKPAATLVEVSRLIQPELLVEIEVDAVISE